MRSTLYTLPATADWSVDATGAARFSWEYDDGRDKLLALYQKGKDKQWDAQKRIDWDLQVDPCRAARARGVRHRWLLSHARPAARGRGVAELPHRPPRRPDVVENSEVMAMFRKLLFSRIVPCVRDIGLWGPRLQQAYVDMGVLELGDANRDALMRQDEDIVEDLDRQRFLAEEEERKAEVHETIAEAAAS